MKNLQDYLPALSQVKKRVIASYDFQTNSALNQIYNAEKKVVTILNHSTPLSWLPAVCVLSEKICNRVDGSTRIPVGVMDKFFFRAPMFRPIAEYLTQFNFIPGFEDIIRKSEAGYTDVAIFPEGSNCFFGPGEVIQPFRSPRFIELALRMKADIFIAVHRGSEDWAHNLQMQGRKFPLRAYLPGWLNEKINRGGFFVVPTFPKRIRHFKMVCEVYRPSLRLEDLSKDRRQRMDQLWKEANFVRTRMQEMFDSLAS